MSAKPENELTNALTMTGCRDEEDLIDMANVGQGLLERIDQLTKVEGPFKNWTPADDPCEIVFDLSNALDDALAIIAQRDSGEPESVAWNIADQEELAALIIRIVGLDDDPIRAIQIKTPMARRAWDAAAQILNSALPPLPQQGEAVAWRFRESRDHPWSSCATQHARDGLIRNNPTWEIEPLYAAPPASQALAEPIPMVLHCPACGLQHIDEATEDWDNLPHRSHLCHGCGHIWRPADVATTGVQAVQTKGSADGPIVAPAEAQARVDDLHARLMAVRDLAQTDILGPLEVQKIRSLTALLSGSTPKPARVEITEEMVMQPPAKPTRAQRDMLERAARAPNGRALGTYGVRQMAGGAKRRMFNAMQSCGWFDRDGVITASGRAALSTAPSNAGEA